MWSNTLEVKLLTFETSIKAFGVVMPNWEESLSSASLMEFPVT